MGHPAIDVAGAPPGNDGVEDDGEEEEVVAGDKGGVVMPRLARRHFGTA